MTRALLLAALGLVESTAPALDPRPTPISSRYEGSSPRYDTCERISLTAPHGTTLSGTICWHARPAFGRSSALTPPAPAKPKRRAA